MFAPIKNPTNSGVGIITLRVGLRVTFIKRLAQDVGKANELSCSNSISGEMLERRREMFLKIANRLFWLQEHIDRFAWWFVYHQKPR